MTTRIEAIRHRTGSAILTRSRDYEVGCLMISQPVFFARADWVADHADWHPRIQMGKTIDVSTGDGQRIFAECVFRRIRPPGPTENGHLVRFNSAARSAPLESTRSRRRR